VWVFSSMPDEFHVEPSPPYCIIVIGGVGKIFFGDFQGEKDAKELAKKYGYEFHNVMLPKITVGEPERHYIYP